MMELFLWAGSAVGVVLGLVHAVYVYRCNAARARGLYAAVWTFGLWTLFGTYVLAFWLIGWVGRAAIRRRRVVTEHE
jgi:hypothetical protein